MRCLKKQQKVCIPRIYVWKHIYTFILYVIVVIFPLKWITSGPFFKNAYSTTYTHIYIRIWIDLKPNYDFHVDAIYWFFSETLSYHRNLNILNINIFLKALGKVFGLFFKSNKIDNFFHSLLIIQLLTEIYWLKTMAKKETL